ncbi:cation/H(+) antiporter 20-like isoform X2 [Humulus lupulus]|uniref:cation/H(+) antiporter 20-like isoform X2 n=1 Tax=Humulus lupulus TaxID=3486 RepID=UPI002B4005DC|nr:cation/H(+) antiporter 20-like isoform X2 [Humulus lupulus]
MPNTTTIKSSSDGAWQGDNPLNYAFPLLILQTILVLFLSRFLTLLLKPLRQPKVIAEILGGILLGPSALGRNQDFLKWVFPSWSTPILESVASIGLLFFLFLVGLELDLTSIRRSGRRAITIALVGMSVPFIFGIGVTFILRRVIKGEEKSGYAQCLVFVGVSLSITAFPVLARILAELKLLTTQVGEMAMAAAAFNDVAAWILLALGVALAGGNNDNKSSSSPLVSIWVLLSGLMFVAFMMLAVRPLMSWVSKQCSSQPESLDEACICLTLAGVMASGFMTDFIGIHSIFGAFIFGLTIPKGGEFAGRLIKRIEDFVSGLLLPLYFASSGLKTDVTKIRAGEAWALLMLVISTSCAGKILGTFVVGMLCKIPARDSLALGVLMNTKGLVELIVLNIGKEKKVLNDEMFAILVMMALFTTFMTTPTVMAIYKSKSPSNIIISSSNSKLIKEKEKENQLRILVCVHGPRSVPSLLNLIQSLVNSPLKLYVMHLVELTDRSSSIMRVRRARKNGFPFVDRFCPGGPTFHNQDQQVAAAFESASLVHGKISLRHTTAISGLSSMHEDILHVAQAKRVSMIILSSMEVLGLGWREVNHRVLKTAPCSVAVFVDRGFGLRPEFESNKMLISSDSTSRSSSSSTATITNIPKKKVCVLFLGGPDDRKALELAERMAHQADVMVTVVRLIWRCGDEHDHERHSRSISIVNDEELDEGAIVELKKRSKEVELIEKVVENGIIETVRNIGQSLVYELVIVGKGRFPLSMVSPVKQTIDDQAQLGSIGDALASSQHVISCSVLVVQHQQLLKSPAPLLPANKDGIIVTARNEEPSLV